MLVRLTIETTHLDARGINYEQGSKGPSVRGDILEGRNWKDLGSGLGPELGCMWENILEGSVTGIFLVHGGPVHWVVEGDGHVPGQAESIEQQVNWRKDFEVDIDFFINVRFGNMSRMYCCAFITYMGPIQVKQLASYEDMPGWKVQEEAVNIIVYAIKCVLIAVSF